VLCVAAGLAYTGGPRPIAYTALGELFVWLFFGLAAVVGTYFLQSGTVSWAAGVAGAMMGWLAAAVLVVNNYRDMDEDRVNGKRTLAVVLGRQGARFEYALFLLLPFAALPAIPALGAAGWTALAGWAAAPQAVAILQRFLRTPAGPALNGVLSDTARLQLVFAALVCAGVLVPEA
jgi:1,4-dihydroxy-2-naphthoate octaprenyltransferase